ncbi:MAG: hypothetical protein K0S91_3131, partial [Nitrososphaeraceae archaeon]|nr:hypothetical protein [Nitrososphaeraceae archaeon]
MYYYYALHIEEQRLISITDGFWFAGYVFLALHLFTVLRSLRGTIKPRIVVIVSIVTVLFVIYNVFNLASSEFLVDVDFAAFI